MAQKVQMAWMAWKVQMAQNAQITWKAWMVQIDGADGAESGDGMEGTEGVDGTDGKNGGWEKIRVFRWFKFTLKPPNSMVHGNFFSAIWDTSHWNFFVKFGLKTPYDIS